VPRLFGEALEREPTGDHAGQVASSDQVDGIREPRGGFDRSSQRQLLHHHFEEAGRHSFDNIIDANIAGSMNPYVQHHARSSVSDDARKRSWKRRSARCKNATGRG
jgi:hypothetical protein